VENVIKFSIKGPEGLYQGEARKIPVFENYIFEILLNNGEKFFIQGNVIDEEGIRKISWMPYIGKKHIPLIPFIGERIESYNSRIGTPLIISATDKLEN
jgi:hypothetical protein